MDTTEIIRAINQEIDLLTRVKAVLASGGENIPSLNKKPKKHKKVVFSAEARAKIAAAQRRRWAKQKAATKATAK